MNKSCYVLTNEYLGIAFAAGETKEECAANGLEWIMQRSDRVTHHDSFSGAKGRWERGFLRGCGRKKRLREDETKDDLALGYTCPGHIFNEVAADRSDLRFYNTEFMITKVCVPLRIIQKRLHSWDLFRVYALTLPEGVKTRPLEKISQLELEKALRDSTHGSPACLANLDLSGLEFRGVDATHSIFAGSIFGGASVQNANFRYSDFRGADFTGCDLRWACFLRANLVDADFTGCNVKGADFTCAWQPDLTNVL